MKPQDVPSTSGIYRITCTGNGCVYIGSAVNLYHRWATHRSDLRRNKHRNPKMQRAFNNYGSETFVFDILELVLVPEMLIPREQFWFDTLNPFGAQGFNIARVAGSTLGKKPSPEAIEKSRLANLGRIPHNKGKKHTPEMLARLRAASAWRGKPGPNLGKKASPETIEKLRSSHLGQPGYWTGKKRDPETIAKSSLKMRGKPSPRRPGYTHSAAHREKLRNANLGKKASDEARRNMSKAQTGRKQTPESIEKIRIANIGRKNSEDAIARMIEAHAKDMKTFVVISPDGIECTVCGIRQFCKDHGLDRRSLQRVAQGKLKQHKGYKVRFPETGAG